MDTSSLTPLTAPPLPGPQALHLGPSPSPEPLQQQIDTALRSFEDSFKRLTEGQDSPALVVSTSGSTGSPKQTVLPASALAASAQATQEATGSSSAQWLLALPLTYVAGAQVLARSTLAGTQPVSTRSLETGSPFTAQDFIQASSRLTAPQRLVSLVPTQLHKLLETPDPQLRHDTIQTLASFTGILLGGAPTPAALVTQAQELNLPVIRTYGSAETAGGCVYEGKPLPGVRIWIEGQDQGQPGRIWLGGPTIASGYALNPARTAAHFFSAPDGSHWYRTDDLGYLEPGNGLLRVQGRADDLIMTGGVKVSAGVVTSTLETHPDVSQALVCGVPDARWGQAVLAAVCLRAGASPDQTRQELAQLVAQKLGPAAVPKQIEFLPDFPLLASGKTDRQALGTLLADTWAQRQEA